MNFNLFSAVEVGAIKLHLNLHTTVDSFESFIGLETQVLFVIEHAVKMYSYNVWTPCIFEIQGSLLGYCLS